MRPLSKTASAVVTVFAVILLLISTTYYWYKNYIYNVDAFADRVVETIQTDQVSNAIATDIVSEALSGAPLLENLLGDFASSAISGLLGSSEFEPVIDKTARKFHEIVIAEEPEDITLDISPIVNISSALLTVTTITDLGVSGEVQDDLEKIASMDTEVVLVQAEEIPSMYNITYTMAWLGPLAGFIGVILLVYALWATADRVQTVVNFGVFLSAGVLLYLLAIPYFQSIVVASTTNPLTRVIVDTVFELFSHDLVNILRVAGIVGLFIILFGFILSIFAYSSTDSKKTPAKAKK